MLLNYDNQMMQDYNLSDQEYRSIVSAGRSLLNDVLDPETGEHGPTELAELIAAELGKWEWLDVSTHPIWDVAAELCIRADS